MQVQCPLVLTDLKPEEHSKSLLLESTTYSEAGQLSQWDWLTRESHHLHSWSTLKKSDFKPI